MDDLDGAWAPGSHDAIGQAVEFLVWASLITQSGGRLHVFLPLLDRGIDAVIHRLEDGAYLALQVKGKTVTSRTEAPIAVYENHLFTPDQLVIGVHLDGDRLGPFVFVADAATLKEKAGRIVDRGRVLLVADMPLRPTPGHKWTEDLVPLEGIAERLGAGGPEPLTVVQAEPPSDEDRVTGFWGELEVIRRAARLEDCGLFRPFPDNETAEVLVRRLATGATIGIQVKTGGLKEPNGRFSILVLRSSFVAAPTTFVVALAWVVSEGRFHENCLVIPSEVLPSISASVGANYELHFRPAGSSQPSRLDRYRVSLESLPDILAHSLDQSL
ncbi:MAG: hypothetical protein NVS9B11_09190 [Candidatus Dormibacteraceae bacterium]